MLCSFGSNLFSQSNPNPQAGQQIDLPQLIRLDSSWKSAEILDTTDCQTIVRGVGAQNEDLGIFIWGYDDSRKFLAHSPAGRDVVPGGLNSTKVKRWLGGEEALGYIDSGGILHSIVNPFASHNQVDKHVLNGQSYRDATISGTGEVLVILSPTSLGDVLPHMDQTTQPDKTSFVLQLWPSFESVVQGSSSPDKQPYTTFTIFDLDPTLTEISIASGAAHFLILIHNNVSTDEHSYKSLVYGFGDNRFGQLGLGSYSTRVDSPELIQGLEGIKSIDCGSFHSLALGADGALYAFGHNRHGQCGVGDTARNLSSPTLVDIGGAGETGNIIDVLQARCGSEHTVALTSEGVWVVGSNSLGQLGTPGVKFEKEFKLNKMIGQLMGVNTKQQEWTIVCGRWNTFVYD